MSFLTTVSKVKTRAQLTNEYSNSEIQAYIDDVEYDIYATYPGFKKFSEFKIESDYDDTYYLADPVGNPAYKIVRIREEVDESVDESGWSEISLTGWTLGSSNATLTVPSAVQSGSNDINYRVDWIPMAYHRLATLMTVKRLHAEGMVFSNNDADSIREERIDAEITTIKKGIKGKSTFFRSSVYENYDPFEYVVPDQKNTD